MYVILVAMFATIFKFRITYAATAFTPYRRSKYTTALAASIPTKILILWSFANFTHPFPSNLQFLLATDCAGFPATTTTGLDPIEPSIDSGRVPMPAPPIPAATTSRLLAAKSAASQPPPAPAPPLPRAPQPELVRGYERSRLCELAHERADLKQRDLAQPQVLPLLRATAARIDRRDRNVAIVQRGAVLGQNRAVHLVERVGERQPGGTMTIRTGRRGGHHEKGRVSARPRERVVDSRHVDAERAGEQGAAFRIGCGLGRGGGSAGQSAEVG
ncbi:hypothetical protein AYI70_g8374 [Smittium culicis]|uniref:Uncharacterized protein n=1 Tax=Smittium culicis TaxID=133412 RepID=A0A1R1XG95_9FUNG|nr:hypothetical protein AYI70_g8374 [Smittium culicis]